MFADASLDHRDPTRSFARERPERAAAAIDAQRWRARRADGPGRRAARNRCHAWAMLARVHTPGYVVRVGSLEWSRPPHGDAGGGAGDTAARSPPQPPPRLRTEAEAEEKPASAAVPPPPCRRRRRLPRRCMDDFATGRPRSTATLGTSVRVARLASGGVVALVHAALAVELAAGARSSARPATTSAGTAPRALPRRAIDAVRLYVAAAAAAQPRIRGRTIRRTACEPRVFCFCFVLDIFALHYARSKEYSFYYNGPRALDSARTKPNT